MGMQRLRACEPGGTTPGGTTSIRLASRHEQTPGEGNIGRKARGRPAHSAADGNASAAMCQTVILQSHNNSLLEVGKLGVNRRPSQRCGVSTWRLPCLVHRVRLPQIPLWLPCPSLTRCCHMQPVQRSMRDRPSSGRPRHIPAHQSSARANHGAEHSAK